MIKFVTGDLLKDDAEALVNTVNCVGVMGKGIALAFKSAFPENFRLYKAACDRGDVKPGRLYLTETSTMFGPKYIVNAATKDHWRDTSRMEWVRDCAQEIATLCALKNIANIAIPALGCANGGLSWSKVKDVLEDAFDRETTEFRIYPPN